MGNCEFDCDCERDCDIMGVAALFRHFGCIEKRALGPLVGFLDPGIYQPARETF